MSDSSLRPVERLHQDPVGGRYRPRERELWTCWTARRWIKGLQTGLRRTGRVCLSRFYDDDCVCTRGGSFEWLIDRPAGWTGSLPGRLDSSVVREWVAMNEWSTWQIAPGSLFEGWLADCLSHWYIVSVKDWVGSSGRMHHWILVPQIFFIRKELIMKKSVTFFAAKFLQASS